MDVILITSVLRPVRDHTIFSTDQRTIQTIKTIETVRAKIPNAYIVMIEGGYMESPEQEKFSKLVDHLFQTNITHLLKSPGEGTLLYRYLTSEHFRSLKDVKSVSKLSGRYFLNDNFNWNQLPDDKISIGFVPKSWAGIPAYGTRYYRIPQQYLQHFIDGLHRYINGPHCAALWPDIEHCFYHYNIIKHDAVFSPKKMGIGGLVTGTNESVDD